MTDNMKARPIENLLEHCERVDEAYGDCISTNDASDWNKNLGWIDALKYVIKTYNCTPKQVENGWKGV